MCKPGEGYVTDEGLCETDDPSGYLIYNGDVVMAMNDEDYQEYNRRKGVTTRNAVKKQINDDAKKARAFARKRCDDGVEYLPMEVDLPHAVKPLDTEQTITI